MNCKLFHKNLISYIEQTVPDNTLSQMNEHLHKCTKCQKTLQEVKTTYGVWDSTPIPELNPFFYTHTEQKLCSSTKPITSSEPWIWKLQPIAAIALLVIGVALGITIGLNLSSQSIGLKPSDRDEILKDYASDYYLSNATEENTDTDINQ